MVNTKVFIKAFPASSNPDILRLSNSFLNFYKFCEEKYVIAMMSDSNRLISILFRDSEY